MCVSRIRVTNQAVIWLATIYNSPAIRKMVNKLLMHHDIDVNKGTFSRKNPLLAAAEDGNENIVMMLLAHSKIDVNYADFNGTTAFSYACFN